MLLHEPVSPFNILIYDLVISFLLTTYMYMCMAHTDAHTIYE